MRPRSLLGQLLFAYLAVALAVLGLVVLHTTYQSHDWGAAYRELLVAGALAVGLLAGMTWWILRRIIRPLEEICRGAERFARGELDRRLPATGAREIGVLARSLNRMAEQLDQHIETILRRENEHLAMLSSMEEAVLAVDARGTVLSVNPACAALLDAGAESLCGRDIHDVIRKADLLQFLDQALAGSAPIDGELRFYGAEQRWLSAHATVLHDAQQRKIGVLAVLRDVTRLRHLENVRREFVANVSHELRTPITAIKGFIETLLDESLEDKTAAVRFLNIVLKQVNRLDAIITDLLTLSRVERGTGEQTIEVEAGPVRPVLLGAVEACDREAAAKGIALVVDCPDGLFARINPPLLEQAVVNLVDNAIKYSDPGASVRIEGAGGPAGAVLRVHDTGCGIAAKHLPRLFERFYRVEKARSREEGGTGLGLAIVKHIVAAHQGTIEVESTPGKGSTFSIHLPALASFPG